MGAVARNHLRSEQHPTRGPPATQLLLPRMRVWILSIWQIALCIICIGAARIGHPLGVDDMASFVAERPNYQPPPAQLAQQLLDRRSRMDFNRFGKRRYREFAPQEYDKRSLIQVPEDDYQAYEPQVPAYQDPNQILFKRMNRKKELKNLYGRIAEKFPFLAKQGLKGDSLDDLFGMTIFGQPKAGK